jgi:hypothetical protein
MHVTGGRLLAGDAGIVCRVCNMENDMFSLDFLSDDRHALAHRSFLSERLSLPDDATLDAACRVAYLNFTKMQRDAFRSDWLAHIASLER